MNARDTEIHSFLAGTDWSDATSKGLAGDASNRRYLRLSRPNGDRRVLMDAPPSNGETIGPFVRIARHLTRLGFSAPQVFVEDANNGFLLLEDLGDDLFARVVESNPDQEIPLYTAAADMLNTLHSTAPPNGLAVMDNTTLAAMTEPVFSWYGTATHSSENTPFEEFQTSLLAVLETQMDAPDTLVLRDFHAENLLWLPDRSDVQRVGLLDFQDALIGHRAYDLVSLLQDARRDVPISTEAAIKAHFVKISGADPDAFDVQFSLLGAQRNLRIIGVFARLCLHAGKPHYVDLIPRVYALAMRNLAHPALQKPDKVLRRFLPEPTPDVLQGLKDKCATIPTP